MRYTLVYIYYDIIHGSCSGSLDIDIGHLLMDLIRTPRVISEATRGRLVIEPPCPALPGAQIAFRSAAARGAVEA